MEVQQTPHCPYRVDDCVPPGHSSSSIVGGLSDAMGLSGHEQVALALFNHPCVVQSPQILT